MRREALRRLSRHIYGADRKLADYQEYLMLPKTFNRSPAEQVLV